MDLIVISASLADGARSLCRSLLFQRENNTCAPPAKRARRIFPSTASHGRCFCLVGLPLLYLQYELRASVDGAVHRRPHPPPGPQSQLGRIPNKHHRCQVIVPPSVGKTPACSFHTNQYNQILQQIFEPVFLCAHYSVGTLESKHRPYVHASMSVQSPLVLLPLSLMPVQITRPSLQTPDDIFCRIHAHARHIFPVTQRRQQKAAQRGVSPEGNVDEYVFPGSVRSICAAAIHIKHIWSGGSNHDILMNRGGDRHENQHCAVAAGKWSYNRRWLTVWGR